MPELAAIGMATTRWLATAKVARPMHAPMIPPPVSSVTSTPADTHSSCVAMLNESLTQGSRPILGNAYASTAAAMATTRKISARATRLRIDKLPLIPATPVHSGNDGLALTRSVPAQHVLRVISHENTPKGVALGAPDTAVCRTASADRRISP